MDCTEREELTSVLDLPSLASATKPETVSGSLRIPRFLGVNDMNFYCMLIRDQVRRRARSDLSSSA
jgi:hypothetical protein